jgi:hypothetical protein
VVLGGMGRRREVVKVAGCLGNRKVRGIMGVRRWMRNVSVRNMVPTLTSR